MTDDHDTQHELAIDRAWDRIVTGQDVGAAVLGDANAITIRRLHAVSDPIAPDPAFVHRLRSDLLRDARTGDGADPAPATVLAPAALPRWRALEPMDRGPRNIRPHWQRFAVATALLLIAGLAGFAGFFDRGESNSGTRLPAAAYATPPTLRGSAPARLTIESIGVVNAPIERAQAIDQVSKDSWAGDLWTVDPSGAWVVAWLDYAAAPGMGGNVVLAGHLDYWDVGPAIFSDLSELKGGDRVEVTSADGSRYAYAVEWSRTYPLKVDADQQRDVLGSTSIESLTLITSAGEFDYKRGEYKETLVVRAKLVSATLPAAPPATPSAASPGSN